MSGAAELDFITRLANAWDGRGSATLSAAECRALWALAYLEPYDYQPGWQQVPAYRRRRLVTAARAAIEFGRTCGAVFGV